jgi:nitrite reductase/ring-hydroxylating ferredoxin subunit
VNDALEWQRLDVEIAQATFPVSAVYAGATIWIFRTETGYRGVQERCPHDERSLGSARIVGDGTMVRCTAHNYTFKLDTGRGVNCPGYAISVYDVVERDGALFVLVRPR